MRKKYSIIALIVAFNLACCFWNDVFGREFTGKADYERTVNETYPIAKGTPIEVLHSMGDLTVTVWDKKEVALTARIEVEGDDAEKFGSQIRIDVTGEGKLFLIETVYPEGKWEDISYGVRMDLVIPATHHLEARNTFGDVDVTGPQAGIEAETSCGSLEVEGVKGEMKLSSSFGKVTLENSSGNTVIKGSTGLVEVDNLFGGNLEISNSFGNVKVKDVAGDLAVNCVNGKISAKNVAGSVRSGGSFGKQFYENVGGSLEATGQNSPVVAEKIGGAATIETTFGSVNAAGVGGSVTIECTNGNIKARGLSYGSGEKGNELTLTSTFGVIEIALPDPPSFDLDASTTFGSISSEFELENLKKGMSSQRCKCTLGGGLADIELTSSNGGIKIKKD